MHIDDDGNEAKYASNLHGCAIGQTEKAFIYRRPLVVSQHSIDRCHFMGTTLSFVVLFNIALAYHLKVIEMLPFMSNRDELVAGLQQPLKLYELAYQLYFQSTQQMDETSTTADQNFVNLRLMMLVTNNISQIHKLAGNDKKHIQCLEHILNAIMFMSYNNGSRSKTDVLQADEKEGIFENLSPILMSDVYAAAA